MALVLKGLRGRGVSDIGADHGISQSQYCRWRNQCFDGAHRAFATSEATSREGQLERENARLKALMAELALEAKKRQGLRMMRGASAKVADRNRELVAAIRAIKAEHHFWGYRRVWAYLRFVREMAVKRKRIYRLMQAHGLLVRPNTRLRAVRTPSRPKPRASRPNQWWGIDMTKAMTVSGLVYVVVVLDWRSKKIAEYYAAAQVRASHWLQALDMAANRQFPHGVRGADLHLMSDNGCQPTEELHAHPQGGTAVDQRMVWRDPACQSP